MRLDAGIDKEIGTGKFTMAELEGEEQSLERLRRWHRDIKARDVFGAPAAVEADRQLEHCVDRLADYTERVFAALRPPRWPSLACTSPRTIRRICSPVSFWGRR